MCVMFSEQERWKSRRLLAAVLTPYPLGSWRLQCSEQVVQQSAQRNPPFLVDEVDLVLKEWGFSRLQRRTIKRRETDGNDRARRISCDW